MKVLHVRSALNCFPWSTRTGKRPASRTCGRFVRQGERQGILVAELDGAVVGFIHYELTRLPQPGNALLRRTRPQIHMTILRKTMRSEAVSQKIKLLS
jgi:hypothetical protein